MHGTSMVTLFTELFSFSNELSRINLYKMEYFQLKKHTGVSRTC